MRRYGLEFVEIIFNNFFVFIDNSRITLDITILHLILQYYT